MYVQSVWVYSCVWRRVDSTVVLDDLCSVSVDGLLAPNWVYKAMKSTDTKGLSRDTLNTGGLKQILDQCTYARVCEFECARARVGISVCVWRVGWDVYMHVVLCVCLYKGLWISAPKDIWAAGSFHPVYTHTLKLGLTHTHTHAWKDTPRRTHSHTDGSLPNKQCLRVLTLGCF